MGHRRGGANVFNKILENEPVETLITRNERKIKMLLSNQVLHKCGVFFFCKIGLAPRCQQALE